MLHWSSMLLYKLVWTRWSPGPHTFRRPWLLQAAGTEFSKRVFGRWKDHSKGRYRPVRKKYDSFKLKNFINKKFWKIFYFFTCILSDYVAHDITKEFWKDSHLENMTAGFLLRCQNWLRYEISLIWHWNINLLKQIWSFVYVKVPNDDQNVI